MSSGGPIRGQVQRLLTAPTQELGRLAAFLSFQARLWRFCAQRLHENNLFAMSAALSFQTIFALIPALVLALLAAGALGVLEDSKTSLRQFLAASGFAEIVAVQESAATSGEAATATAPAAPVINVADEIERTVALVQSKLTFDRIGPIGALLFIWSALSLLSTMEDSLNRVFGAARNRSAPRRVLLYWSTMTLGPVVLAVASFLGSRAMHATQGMPILSGVSTVLAWSGPALVGVLVLSAVYILLPNTRVNRNAALGGALAAVAIWLLARWAFALYIERFVVKGNLYGILGVLPLFFMWLNFSWLIFLFGAELAHATANVKGALAPLEPEHQALAPTDFLSTSLAVAHPFEAGTGPVALEQIVAVTGLTDYQTRQIAQRLVAAGVLCSVRSSEESDPCFALARPAERIRVADVLDLAEEAGPVRSTGFASAIAGVHERRRLSLGEITLRDLIQRAADGPLPR